MQSIHVGRLHGEPILRSHKVAVKRVKCYVTLEIIAARFRAGRRRRRPGAIYLAPPSISLNADEKTPKTWSLNKTHLHLTGHARFDKPSTTARIETLAASLSGYPYTPQLMAEKATVSQQCSSASSKAFA